MENGMLLIQENFELSSEAKSNTDMDKQETRRSFPLDVFKR